MGLLKKIKATKKIHEELDMKTRGQKESILKNDNKLKP